MFQALHQYIEWVLSQGPNATALFLIGSLLGASVLCLYRWYFPSVTETDVARRGEELAHKNLEIKTKDDEIRDLKLQLKDRDSQLASLRDQISLAVTARHDETTSLQEKNSQLSESCVELKNQANDLATKCAALLKENDDLEQEVTDLEKQVIVLSEQRRQILEQDGQFWEAAVPADTPVFRPRKVKNAIIAITNLKGGVGKTTITANLAATFCSMNIRVLVVDLDHQTSLTSLCLSLEQINDLRPGTGRFVNNVLRACEKRGEVAWNNVAQINGQGAHILAASKELAQVEEHVKARWLVNASPFDARYILREALHHPIIQDRFDLVLLDCPPRPSTCLINAIACSDYALIPTLPDRTSAETVPYLLGWLKKLRELKISPDLSILGVMANGTYRQGGFTSREKAVWEDLEDHCGQEWGSPVYRFQSVVPDSNQFAEAASTRSFAALHPKLHPVFQALGAEILDRTAYESSRTTAIS